MSDIIEVIKDVTTVTIASDGPQGPAGPTGPTGPEGAAGAPGSSGVISVVAPITNTGTSTSAIIGINAGVANGVATLDSGGKVPQSQIPAVAITNTFVVASQAAMLALTAEEGDVAVRTDQNKTYILTATPSSTLANWQELLTPTDTVTSVDGRIGTVTLTDKYAQLATANTFTGGVQQITTASASTIGLIVKGTASQTFNLQEWQNNGGSVLTAVTSGGDLIGNSALLGFGYGRFGGSRAYVDETSVRVTTRAAGQKGLVVTGAASQTANLQDWQDSAATVLASINSAGQVSGNSFLANTGSTNAFGGNLISGVILAARTSNAAIIPLAVRGAASQTANLQEWQNSAGSILSFVRSDGVMFATSGLQGSAWLSAGSFIANAQLISNVSSASNVGVLVRGAASQTGDLQQWQNSAGTVLAKIGADGVLRGNGTFLAGAAGSTAPQFDANGNFTAQQIGSNQAMIARQIVASQVPMTVRGAASQTANLLELQTSASAVLTSITAAGTINFQSGNTSATANTGAVALPALAVGFITMQVAGTTVKVPYYAN